MRETELELQELAELLGRALDLDEGDEQIATLEEAVRVADIEGDLELQYGAREALVRACIFGGASEKALVAFAWLLAQFDKHPGKFDQWAILWKYKWIVAQVCSFPNVSKARIYKMLDDLSARSEAAGYGLRAVYNHRYRTEKFWDNREKAVEYFHKMQELPEDGLSNCPACETDERVSFSIYSGHDERAVELAQPILDTRQKCASVPHRTYANILLPLLRLGRQKEAVLYHHLGYDLICNNKTFLDKVGEHLVFLALTQNFESAITLVEKHYLWTEQNRDVLSQFRFFRAAWLLFEMLAEQHEGSLELRLPRSFPLYSESGRYEPTRLAAWFKQKATEIARRFDERNETDFFARTLDQTLSLKALSEPFPLLKDFETAF
jgi:hypothetical protein